MAFPEILSYASFEPTANATSITVPVPAGLSEGDTWVAMVGASVQVSGVEPTGFTQIVAGRGDKTTDIAGVSFAIHSKTAGASESPVNFTVSSGRHCVLALRMTPGSVIVETGINATTGSAGAIPTNSYGSPIHNALALTDSHDYLLLAAFMASRSDLTFTSPSGYGGQIVGRFGTVSSSTGYPYIGVS